MPRALGSTLGSYRILSLIGTGGMGAVYRAHDPRLGRDVALKVIQGDRESRADAVDRLLGEATLASSLNHPNIVTVFETGAIDGDRYVAMELVQGETVRALAKDGLTIERTLEIIRQVSEALAVAHAARVVHRDIKPENIMVRPDGYVKVLDFGLARMEAIAGAGRTMPGSAPGVIVGTVAYMAPEQARGEPATSAVDVFALGVVMYELLTGRHPFAAASQAGTLHALLYETPEPPGRLNADLPRAIEQLVLDALQKDPRLRPGAEEVMYRLALARHSTIAAALSPVTVAPLPRGRAPAEVVGREQELDCLREAFNETARGAGRVVVISAEAGMGKTTLVEAFVRLVEEGAQPARIGRGRCSERLAGSEAYLPVLEALESLQRDEQLGNLSRVVRAVAPSWYVQLAPPAAGDPSGARLAAETAAGSSERLKRELVALLEEIGRTHPVIVSLDDLHWADPSTTDLIAYLAQRIEGLRVLLVVTARPSGLAQARHPFLALKHDLIARGIGREVKPGPLDEAAVARYLALRFPQHGFPGDFAALIHRRTEGQALFMADLLQELRRRQVIRQVEGRWVLDANLDTLQPELPESVRALLHRTMEALDEADRRLLAAASVQGLDFDTAIVAGALQIPAEDVEQRLERLEREHALVRFVDEWEYPDGTLTLRHRFAHHVYQNAFHTTLRATRRAAVSRAVAEQLVRRLGDRVRDGAANVALIFETAREPVRAAECFTLAAQHALRLYAHGEAAQLAQRGLEQLRRAPDGAARDAAELDLQMAYGLAVKTGEGYAVTAVGKAYARARELARRVADPSRVVPVLTVMAAHHVVAGEITTSRDVALEMVELFGRLGDRNLMMIGEWSLGVALFHLSELEPAHRRLTRAMELYDPAFHRPRVWETGIEPGIFCRCELSRTLTLRGYPDQGLACVRDAVADARALDHPQPLAFALLFEIFAHLARRAPNEVLRDFDELAALCSRHGIAQELQWAAPLRGRALIELGEVTRGVQEIEQGLAAHAITRSALLRPYYFVLFAGALVRCGRHDEAQRALDQARVVADETGQHAYDPEHDRIQGVLHTIRQEIPEAEAAFQRALRVAQAQGARWLELRAARAYAHLLVSQNRPAEGAARLAPLCAHITEGRDTADYAYAEALLRSLG